MDTVTIDKWNPNELALVMNHGKGDSGGFKYRYVILEGGGGSGKTVSAGRYIASWMWQEDGIRCGAFRFDAARHVDGMISDFNNVILPGMKFTPKQARIVGQPKSLVMSNGSELAFRGMQDQMRGHGPRWTLSYHNEVLEIPWESFINVAQRTAHLVIMDFNPSVSKHWIYDKYLSGERDDVLHVRSTQLDNPFLPDGERQTILDYEPTKRNIKRGTADAWRWEVYGLGRRGRRQGVVFQNWELCYEWPKKELCERHGYGIDLGWIDPTTLTECCLYNGDLYVRERIYESDLMIQESETDKRSDSLVGRMDAMELDKSARYHCECADPRTIQILKNSGYNVHATVKSPHSILRGLDTMKSRRIFVWHESQNAQSEFENYTWKKDRAGVFTGEPIDDYNHLIDGVRYWALEELDIPKAKFKRSSYNPNTRLQNRRF